VVAAVAAGSRRTVEIDDMRMVDYTGDGRVVGVEFVSPSAGIDRHDIPFAETVEKVICHGDFPSG
jgi:uncharacterized protein YuzE